MNYAAHYERLITRARGRSLDGYRERHHVLPKCVGGNNSADNIVELTAEEHYVAHQLLVHMYPGNRSLIYSANFMTRSTAQHQRPNNKIHGWLRKKMADALRGNKHGLGTKKSPEAIERTAAAHRGKILSAETKKKVVATRIGKPLSPAHRAKLRAALLGNKNSLGVKQTPEHIATRSRRGKPGKPHTAESKAKIAAAKRGSVMSKEARAKMSAAHLGRPHSPSHRANLAAANRARAKRNKGSSERTLPLF